MILLWLMAFSAAYSQEWRTYPYTPDGSLVSFPVDEGRHPGEPIEWWYMAGHLTGETTGTSYSFMLTYFYYPTTYLTFEFDGFRILNLANDDTGEFFTETMPVVEYTDLAVDHLHINALLYNQVQEQWFHREEPAGTRVPFEYEVSAESEHGAIDISTISLKRPLIPGDDGLFDQGERSYTYYYSFTWNSVEGTITMGGLEEEVTGSAWIDRQYGTFNPNTEEKYEWFFLQLSNGMDLNIWNLFTPENQQLDSPEYRHLSAYVDEDMNTQYTTHEFALERHAWTQMQDTENYYAREWRLTSDINLLDLHISTQHQNSEVTLPFPFFEGSVMVSGTVNGVEVTGKGFAELPKLYEPPQLKITTPKSLWYKDFPIAWKVLDPDDGRPLSHDLEYSSDQGGSWLPLVQGTSDTLFYWNDPPFENGDSCLFRVTGYTTDRVLEGAYLNAMHTIYDDQYTSIDLPRKEQVHGDRVWIYPNPTQRMLYLRCNQVPYNITDLTGRLLLSGTVRDGQIDVGELNRGIYLVHLVTPEGTSSLKFLKE